MRLLDSNIYIYLSKRNKKAHELFLKEETAMSAITCMEMIDGAATAPPQERIFTQRLLSTEVILPVTKEIAVKAGELRAERRKTKALPKRLVADVIIAATAMVHNIPLLTANAKDFKKFRGLHVQKFKP